MNRWKNNGDRTYRSLVPNTKRVQSPFSYYGSKSRIAHLYAPPKFDHIIEPFAGSAPYAWLHRRNPDTGKPRQVDLYDLNSETVAVWKFLQSPDALQWIDTLPASVAPGQTIDSLMPSDAPEGFRLFVCAELSRGQFGKRGTTNKVTSFGAYYYYSRLRAKLEIVCPEVRHWNIECRSFETATNTKATWFIDPPYANVAGSLYRKGEVNYTMLADFCRSRDGQVIVCENIGADWLDFSVLTDTRTTGRHTTKTNVGEVVWYHDSDTTHHK